MCKIRLCHGLDCFQWLAGLHGKGEDLWQDSNSLRLIIEQIGINAKMLAWLSAKIAAFLR